MKLPIHLEKAMRACVTEAEFRKTMNMANRHVAAGAPESEVIDSLKGAVKLYAELAPKDPFDVNEKQ